MYLDELVKDGGRWLSVLATEDGFAVFVAAMALASLKNSPTSPILKSAFVGEGSSGVSGWMMRGKRGLTRSSDSAASPWRVGARR
jgi:hypothetical protein